MRSVIDSGACRKEDLRPLEVACFRSELRELFIFAVQIAASVLVEKCYIEEEKVCYVSLVVDKICDYL